MKNAIVLILVGLISQFVNAQKIIEKSLDYQDQYIELEVSFASLIEVKTWDKSSVYFKADIRTKDGKYLDAYKLDINESARTIAITSDAKGVFKKFQDEWNTNHPNKKKRYYNTGDSYEFNYVLYVPKNAKLKVSSINGDLKSELIEGDFAVDLINGDIDIATYSGSLDLNTINGEIDLTMRNADVIAETIHGDIYADEKLEFTSTNRHVGQKIAGRQGQGSNRLRLNTINGNMYLRL